MTAIIIIGVLALLVLWVIGVQRKLVEQEEFVKNAMSQIGVQQNSRWDALTALVELVKGYNEHEYNTLKDVIAMRKPITGSSTAADVEAQEAKVVERYPELKANEMFNKTMDSVNVYENQVRTARMVYNDSVTKYNKVIRQIPENIVAALFHFTAKDYLTVEDKKTEMPSMKV